MKQKLAHLLTYLYPRRWRDRYGKEFEAFLLEQRGGLHATVDVIRAALSERIFPSQTHPTNPGNRSFGVLVRQPSAFIPIAMSLTALSVVLGHIAMSGVVREADEGAAAHIWQLLMAGQMPVLLYFAIKWLPVAPRQTLYVLAMQAGSVLASMVPVFYFNL